MRTQERAIVLDGAVVMRLAAVGITHIWNVDGVLMGQDEDGNIFPLPDICGEP